MTNAQLAKKFRDLWSSVLFRLLANWHTLLTQVRYVAYVVGQSHFLLLISECICNFKVTLWRAENNAQQTKLPLTLGIGLLGTLHHCCFKILQCYNNSNSNNIKLFSSSPINFFRENDFFLENEFQFSSNINLLFLKTVSKLIRKNVPKNDPKTSWKWDRNSF